MKKLFILFAIIGCGFYIKNHNDQNPEEITDPVYLESRVIMVFPELSRDLEFVLLGEMTSDNDCQRRADRYVDSVLEHCPACTIKSTECKVELRDQYAELFSDALYTISHISLTKGDRFERSGKLVVWGLTDAEKDVFCETMKVQLEGDYKGSTECI